MAGRNQHYLWAALQRGFAEKRGDGHFVKVTKRDGSSFVSNVRNVGAERDFYSQAGGIDADEKITHFENETARLLSETSRIGDISTDHSQELAELIAHLEVRSKNLRIQMEEIFRFMMMEFQNKLGDPEFLAEFFIGALNDDISILEKKLRERVRYRALSYPLAYLLRPLILRQIHECAENFSGQIKELMPRVFGAIDFKELHLKSLQNDVRFPLRANNYKDLVFTNTSVPTTDLVLPDTGLCFISDGRVAPFFQGGHPPEMIIFPRGPGLATVGHAGAVASISGPLPQLMAACAAEFVVSHPDAPISDQTVEAIGSSVAVLTEADMRVVFDELWETKSLRTGRKSRAKTRV